VLFRSRVHNETRQWLVDGVGIVGEKREERTKLLGVQIRLNREAWVLEERGAVGGGRRAFSSPDP